MDQDRPSTRNWENAIQDVEDVPEDVASFVGDGVGRVGR